MSFRSSVCSHGAIFLVKTGTACPTGRNFFSLGDEKATQENMEALGRNLNRHKIMTASAVLSGNHEYFIDVIRENKLQTISEIRKIRGVTKLFLDEKKGKIQLKVDHHNDLVNSIKHSIDASELYITDKEISSYLK